MSIYTRKELNKWFLAFASIILIAIFPIIILFTNNAQEVSINEIFPPLIIAIAICISFFPFCSLTMRTPGKSGLAAIVLVTALFNYSLFDTLVCQEYGRLAEEFNPSWTLDEILGVFHLFLKSYEQYTHTSHPPITRKQIAEYIIMFPVVFYDNGYYGTPIYDCYGDIVAYHKESEELGEQIDLSPEDYRELIPQYFTTRYQQGCNYRIHHFMSGNIRVFLMLNLNWL